MREQHSYHIMNTLAVNQAVFCCCKKFAKTIKEKKTV